MDGEEARSGGVAIPRPVRYVDLTPDTTSGVPTGSNPFLPVGAVRERPGGRLPSRPYKSHLKNASTRCAGWHGQCVTMPPRAAITIVIARGRKAPWRRRLSVPHHPLTIQMRAPHVVPLRKSPHAAGRMGAPTRENPRTSITPVGAAFMPPDKSPQKRKRFRGPRQRTHPPTGKHTLGPCHPPHPSQ